MYIHLILRTDHYFFALKIDSKQIFRPNNIFSGVSLVVLFFLNLYLDKNWNIQTIISS